MRSTVIGTWPWFVTLMRTTMGMAIALAGFADESSNSWMAISGSGSLFFASEPDEAQPAAARIAANAAP